MNKITIMSDIITLIATQLYIYLLYNWRHDDYYHAETTQFLIWAYYSLLW